VNFPLGFLEVYLTDKRFSCVWWFNTKSDDSDTKISDLAIFYIESLTS
jgi:hypothetical protein